MSKKCGGTSKRIYVVAVFIGRYTFVLQGLFTLLLLQKLPHTNFKEVVCETMDAVLKGLSRLFADFIVLVAAVFFPSKGPRSPSRS